MRTLKALCQQYIDVIQKIERTSDPLILQRLEEQRVDLHNQVLDAFDRLGIAYHDRQDVERQAWKLANE
jgi:hypothetical protein